jgi:hypothetical protein
MERASTAPGAPTNTRPRGSSNELPAFTQLEAAEEQFAAREAWLKWIDRGY